jgi:UDP-GlcNAc3NAcA epimerase
MKLAPVSKALRTRHEEIIVHTGQHYDASMSTQFFTELNLPAPDYNLEVGSAPHGEQTGRMLCALEPVLMNVHPDWILVFGDTNTTLAGALAAVKLGIPLAHVESGMRSYRREQPEEINRVLVDHMATRLYCSTERAAQNLAWEGLIQGVETVGDVTCDLLMHMRYLLAEQEATQLATYGLDREKYVLATVHRAANVDQPERLAAIVRMLNEIDLPVLFPVHPRTRQRLQACKLEPGKHIKLIDPIGYIASLALIQGAWRVVTDSGGIQKEAYLLHTPCLTLREETEWLETVEAGWNTLVGVNGDQCKKALQEPAPEPFDDAPFGRGDAAQRIVASLQTLDKPAMPTRVPTTRQGRNKALEIGQSTVFTQLRSSRASKW